MARSSDNRPAAQPSTGNPQSADDRAARVEALARAEETRAAEEAAAKTAEGPQLSTIDPPPAGERHASAERRPECPYHKCACESRRSEPFFTRYYCPQPGCGYSEKVARPTIRRERDAADQRDSLSAR